MSYRTRQAQVQASLESQLLRHLCDGGRLDELAPRLGMSLDELACRVDLKSLGRKVTELRRLQEQCEALAASRERFRAGQQLSQLLDKPLGAETARRVCTQILREPRIGRPGRSPQRQSAACHFLCQTLAGGPRSASEVLDLARQAGIAQATLQRAKGPAQVVTVRQGFGSSGRFVWKLIGSGGGAAPDGPGEARSGP